MAVEVGGSESKEERSLEEILEEKEEVKKKDMKWSQLPPPNMDLYKRRPVLLLNWEDTTVEEFSTNDAQVRTDLDDSMDVIIDLDDFEDDSFSPIDKDEQKQQELNDLSVTRVDDHFLSSPKFNVEEEDYGSGSDMDLFAGEDLDRLYDDVDQQLLQDERLGLNSGKTYQTSSSSVATSGGRLARDDVLVVDDTPPKARAVVTDMQGYSQKPSGCGQENHGIGMKKQTIDQACGSNAHNYQPLASSSRSTVQESVRGREKEASVVDEVRSISSRRIGIDQPHSPPSVAKAALLRRSSSADSKQSSTDSDELPPVVWGHAVKPMSIKEPKAHCSKDLLQPPSFPSSSQSTSAVPVADRCPVCDMLFPSRWAIYDGLKQLGSVYRT